MFLESPEIKNKFKEAGKIGKLALQKALSEIEPNRTFIQVAEAVEKEIMDLGGKPSFPVNLSVDNEAAHFTPAYNDKKVFRTGDVVKVDIGASIDGCLSDNAATIEVGESGKYSDLIDSTREALQKAISSVRPGQQVRTIGRAINEVISSYGFKPVKNLGGHGIGIYDLHSAPFIPNYDDSNGYALKAGTVIAIEPFASTGIGMIHNGPGGNIYIWSAPKADETNTVYKSFNTIPFAGRWLHDLVPDHTAYIKTMLKKKLISQFAILKEHRGAMIAQSEHTIIIENDGITVTTA